MCKFLTDTSDETDRQPEYLLSSFSSSCKCESESDKPGSLSGGMIQSRQYQLSTLKNHYLALENF